MPKTKKFSQLTDAARRDPIRRTRIDAARKRAAQEIAQYRLAELRQALGLTKRGWPSSSASRRARSLSRATFIATV